MEIRVEVIGLFWSQASMHRPFNFYLNCNVFLVESTCCIHWVLIAWVVPKEISKPLLSIAFYSIWEPLEIEKVQGLDVIKIKCLLHCHSILRGF